MRLTMQWLIVSVLLFLTLTTQAEQKQNIAGFDVHYMAYNAAMLSPEVARNYGIQRSKILGVVMIAIKKGEQAYEGIVRGQVQNQISQIQNLEFKRIREGEARYYIATFRFADTETLRFNIDFGPTGEQQLYPLSFSQQFFVD